MKIRTQNACMYIEFEEAYTTRSGDKAAVYVKSRCNREAVLAGVYEDEERAKGVLYEMGLAHQNRERAYYMPVA